MKLPFYKTIFILLCITLFSCQNKKTKPYQAGVVISFDDAYVDDWFEADKVLRKYDWKATFCVCRIDSIGKPQLEKLHQLQSEGHEIAGHGYHHYNAVKFVQKNGIDEYLKQEIDPMIASMKRLKFNVSSFAYPYGERSSELDSALSRKFKMIRGRDFQDIAPQKEGCYYRDSKFIYAFDIDNEHVNFSVPYLLELLDTAKKNNKILILSSHQPVKKLSGNYQTKLETLELICKYMKSNNMKFYTLADLGNLQPDN